MLLSTHRLSYPFRGERAGYEAALEGRGEADAHDRDRDIGIRAGGNEATAPDPNPVGALHGALHAFASRRGAHALQPRDATACT
jgi:hypothetical protein